MNRHRTLIALVTLVLAVPVAQGATRSVCDYYPPDSHVRDLGLQGWLNWYDGPYADNRERAISASLVADYAGLSSSATFGHTLDARAEIRGTADAWTAALVSAGTLRSHLDEALFLVGALGLDADTDASLELDATAGIGSGQFRDVTPLARAITLQNDLLDLGELLAPIGDDALLAVARILGETGPTGDEKAVGIAEALVATELLAGEVLGIRGLLAVEEAVAADEPTRLCGRDVQARIGVTTRLLPDVDLAAAGVLVARLAAVPDPVSQFESRAEAKIRLARPDELAVDAEVSYERRLPDDWTARAEYRLVIDRMWTAPETRSVAHAISASITTQLAGSVGVTLAGEAAYETGDEEISFTLTIHLEANVL